MLIDTTTQTKAALKVFFTAVDEWGLSDEQGQQLLNISNNQYLDYMQGTIDSTSHDLMSRLAFITMIYGNLKQLFSVKNIQLWLKNTSEPDSIWKGSSPLEVMLNDFGGIVMVHNHLSYLNGGA